MRQNALGQPIGDPVDFPTAPRPPRTAIDARYCSVVPAGPQHVADLFAAIAEDPDGASWTYMPYGPFPTLEDYRAWAVPAFAGDDPLFHAIVDRGTGKPVGVAALMRIDPKNGVIEVGSIHFTGRLRRSRAATEAMYLLMRRAFDELGYRRYEWKCDDLNAPSRKAALRYGFVYEGTFRQAVVYKGRNRDTAWFSILDREWPRVKAAFEAWLEPSNFDADGRQRCSLAELRASVP